MLRSVTLCDMVPFTFTRLLDSYAIEKRTAFQQWVKTLYEIVFEFLIPRTIFSKNLTWYSRKLSYVFVGG